LGHVGTGVIRVTSDGRAETVGITSSMSRRGNCWDIPSRIGVRTAGPTGTGFLGERRSEATMERQPARGGAREGDNVQGRFAGGGTAAVHSEVRHADERGDDPGSTGVEICPAFPYGWPK
jgi:hypothetical protein